MPHSRPIQYLSTDCNIYPQTGLPPERISTYRDFPFGVKRFCPGHNKIDMSVIQCRNLQSVDNIGYVNGREKVDKLVFF